MSASRLEFAKGSLQGRPEIFIKPLQPLGSRKVWAPVFGVIGTTAVCLPSAERVLYVQTGASQHQNFGN